MLANAITLTHLLLTFAVIVLFDRHHNLNIALIGTIAFIFILDAVDGSVARKRNETSETGQPLISCLTGSLKTPSGFISPQRGNYRYGCRSRLWHVGLSPILYKTPPRQKRKAVSDGHTPSLNHVSAAGSTVPSRCSPL